MTRPDQTALVATKVPAITLGFYAHVDYADRHGMPSSVDDLLDHRLIGPDRTRMDLALAQAVVPGLERGSFMLRTDCHAAVLRAVQAGLGIGVVHRAVGERDPNLVAVLPQVDVATLETWIVAHERLLPVARIRAVFDHLVEELTTYGSCAD
jgi:DNA-binding transcriptional LysR family regulator